MTLKRALIVDDSRTAQVRLRKMLDRYELGVDTANSAEEALNYLSYKVPSVIFMDHLMTGMDGFEALKIIKSNARTAMIPIIMYTSKSGDVYVGQARALGAIDVLSKDVIEASSLDKVLQGVNISLKGEVDTEASVASANGAASVAAAPAEQDVAATPAPSSVPSAIRFQDKPQDDPDSVRHQVAKLLEINMSKIRHEIAEYNKLLIRRISREISDLKPRKEQAAAPAPTPTKVVEPPLQIPPPVIEQSGGKLQLGLIVVLLAVVLIASFKLFDNGKKQQALIENYAELTAFVQAEYDSVVNENEKLATSLEVELDQLNPNTLLEAIAWGINLQGQFEFGDQALGEKKFGVLNELVNRLHAANFVGTVTLNVHFGNFCIVTNANGEFVLPEGGSSIYDCELLSNQAQGFSLENQLSLPFINFLSSSPLLNDGTITIEMESYGIDQPVLDYPPLSSFENAGEWNSLAAVNNRIQVTIVAAE